MGGHKLHIITVVLSVGISTQLAAQYHTQVGLGNYGPVNSLYINPSLNAYSACNWQLHLAGAWANVNNNYLTLQTPYSLYRLPNAIPQVYQTESGNPRFDKQWLRERLNGRDKVAASGADIYGPALSMKVKKWHLGFLTEASANVRLNQVPEALAHAVFKELDSAQGAFSLSQSNGNNTIGPFSITGNSRAAVGFNISRAIQLDWKRQFLGGITIKKVWGFQGFHLSTTGMSSQQINQDSLLISPTNIRMMDYGTQPGHGWGVDIGATYVFHKKDFKRRGDYAQNHTKYYAKMGFSIMDIGSVKYTDATFRSVNISSSTGIRLDQSYSGTNNYGAALDSFMQTFGTYTISDGNVRIGLPTRAVISADMQVKKHLFVSGIITQSLRSKSSVHARYQSFLMLSPRLEYRFFEWSLPVSLQYDYRSLRMGTSFRFGPLYIGTNSLMTFLNTRRMNDADIFAGLVLSNLSEFSFRKQARNRSKNKKSKPNTCFVF